MWMERFRNYNCLVYYYSQINTYVICYVYLYLLIFILVFRDFLQHKIITFEVTTFILKSILNRVGI